MAHKQTWWDGPIKTQFEDFKSWVGTPQSYSKKFIRNYIINKGYKSVVDIGCGMCDDYFVYQSEHPDVTWLGVDSSGFLNDKARESNIPVKNEYGDDTKLADNQFEVAYSRHVLEHQASFKPILKEMVRIAEKRVIHVFFIRPREVEIINFQKDTNLYHNTYVKEEIEDFLMSMDKVVSIGWSAVGTETEEALIVKLKNPSN